MTNKKYLLLILIILSLFCLISSASAENSDLTDNTNNSIIADSNLQPSISLEQDTNQKLINTSNKTDTASSTNQNVNNTSKKN